MPNEIGTYVVQYVLLGPILPSNEDLFIFGTPESLLVYNFIFFNIIF